MWTPIIACRGLGSEERRHYRIAMSGENSGPTVRCIAGCLVDCRGSEIDRARRALRLQLLKVSEREDAFAAVIRCTADPAKADKRTRSKWSRVMRYAAMCKPVSEPLGRFIRRKGGANECAARFTRWLGEAAQRGYEHLSPAPPEASRRAGLFVRIVQSFQPSSIAEKGPGRCGMRYNLPLLALVGQHTRGLGRFTHWLRSAV
jgi:hypothetical protein